ncbi:MAG: hypothetical protein A2Y73_01720 [Chloroflexi bacterium RBG_13_56_8]|nr:MAG: hypothetical protein A2Y73_01720 [Chloroflexi bacterium RBG_13_56_8]
MCLLESLKAGCAWLDQHVAQVNALNVFPVPDGDTGTNMSLTMQAALAEVNSSHTTSASALGQTVAQGALMGARGNSGVILSQILRGFARALDSMQSFDGVVLAEALQQGSITAYKGVMKPVEGTILTVIRESAEAAKRASARRTDVEHVLASAVTEAQASVERTPSLLPVLAEAGVVDAGGQGLSLILEGMLRYLRGESIAMAHSTAVEAVHVHAPDGDYNYDTQFVIRGTNLDVESIRHEMAKIGDSVMVVGTDEAVKVHVHCDFPGKAVDYGISQGQVTSVIVENMQLQYQEFKAAQQAARRIPAGDSASAMPISEIGIIAVASGEGLVRVFEGLGASAVVPGGQTMNPSTQELLQAIDSVESESYILLPNNSNIILAAQQAKELSSKHVEVVPTQTIPQGIAALLAFNYQADLETNVELMLTASQAVQTVEITKAVRSVQVNDLSIAEGQTIGLLNGELVTVSENPHTAVEDLLKRVGATEYEIITIYFGEDVTSEEAAALAEHIKQIYPHIEVESLDGGQAHYHYIISIE